MGQKLRTTLPMTPQQLKPHLPNASWPIELIQSVGALVHFIPPYSPALDLV